MLLVGDSADNMIVRVDLGAGDTADFGLGGVEAPFRDAVYLGTVDFDGDGYRDLQLLATWGATGNLGYMIWRYRPDTDRLQRDDLLSDLGNPTPVANGRCVLTRGTGGAAGRIFSESVLCWRDARLVEVERVRQDVDAAAFIRRAWRALPGADTLVLVATDTLPAG